MSAYLAGFGTSLSLIVAIGAQNAFVLKQGLLRHHVFATCAFCALSDALLITLGVAGFGALVQQSPLLLALARWKPEDILNAIEIRQVTAEALDCFSPPRDPRILPRPTREFAHLYMWIGCQWVHVLPQADAPGV